MVITGNIRLGNSGTMVGGTAMLAVRERQIMRNHLSKLATGDRLIRSVLHGLIDLGKEFDPITPLCMRRAVFSRQ